MHESAGGEDIQVILARCRIIDFLLSPLVRNVDESLHER